MVSMAGAESADTFTGDSDTTSGNWSTKQSIGEGTGTSGMSIISQWKVLTATSAQSWTATFTAADARASYILVIETDALARGAGSNSATESATTITFTEAMASGSTGVICFAADNAGANGSAANIPTSLTDSKSNTWTLQQTQVYDNGAASAGAEVGIYTSLLGTAIARGDTVAVTYQAVNVVAKAWGIWEFAGYTYGTTTATNTGTSTSLSLSNGTITNANVVISAAAIEGGLPATTFDTDTTNGSWSTNLADASGSGATGDMGMVSQYKIVNATGAQTWNLTITFLDWATAGITLAPPATTGTYLHFFDFFP
jgi:hypothetical protein